MRLSLVAPALVLALAACGEPAGDMDETPPAPAAELEPEPVAAPPADLFGGAAGAFADLRNGSGAAAGRAEFIQTPAGLLIRVRAEGLTPGWHGLHLHAVGSCQDAGFQSAGGHVHLGPAAQHGLRNPAGPEHGDLPNLFVGADGRGAAELYTSMARLTGGATNLIDADGSAILIHAGPDDHMTQPIGGSGDRVVCGAIVAPGGPSAATTPPAAGAGGRVPGSPAASGAAASPAAAPPAPSATPPAAATPTTSGTRPAGTTPATSGTPRP
jgi:Cu-Zn family superoxide dismutase